MSSASVTPAHRLRPSPSAAGVLFIAGTAAALAGVGADARWLVALGRVIIAEGSIPHGVPFASAVSDHWHNVPVAAEVVFDGLHAALGDRGLALAQIVAVCICFATSALLARSPSASASRVCARTPRLAPSTIGELLWHCSSRRLRLCRRC